MIVNKSMFPLQTGFGVISKMQDKFATLQMQLGTGEKANTLAEMGRDLPMSLSVRSRLAKIEGFSANIDTVNLRLSFLDKTMTRFDKIEGEARNSAIQGQYGTNDINMATLPGLSKGRLDEIVTLLNSDVAGRYLFGGSMTDKAPLPSTDVLLDGQAGKAGFKTVVTERKAADAGLDGRGRLGTSYTPDTNVVGLAEDGVHPFGMKISTLSTTASGSVTLGTPGPSTAPLGDATSISFLPEPAEQIKAGQTITIGLTLPDGTETQMVLTAATEETKTGAVGEFVIGEDANETAAAFQLALDAKLLDVGNKELSAASTFAASQNFFNGPGEPALRVDGNPATATSLKVATEADTVLWYSGQSPAVSAANMGRLSINTTSDSLATPPSTTVTLAQDLPASADYGFKIAGITALTGAMETATDAVAGNVSVKFTAQPAPGDKVEVTLSEPPNGTLRTVSLTAVQGKAGPGQFSISATGNVEETAANFAKGLNLVVDGAARAAEGNTRQSVTAQVDDNTRVNYGMQANESGFLRMMRTMASMSIETYPSSDETSRARFDAMAVRQQSEMSEGHNAEAGSIEILTMELGVARGTLESATKRHTDYKAQLDNLLSDIETVSKEDVAMEILALQTRLQASYQTTSMVSKLSLVNFI